MSRFNLCGHKPDDFFIWCAWLDDGFNVHYIECNRCGYSKFWSDFPISRARKVEYILFAQSVLAREKEKEKTNRRGVSIIG